MKLTAAFIASILHYGPVQQHAVVAEFATESGLDTAAASRSGKHMGLAQWAGPRKAALIQFARRLGKHWTDGETQLRFFDAELRQMAFARRFFSATTETAARALLCHEYLRAARC